MSLYQNRPVFSSGPLEACERLRVVATDDDAGLAPAAPVRGEARVITERVGVSAEAALSKAISAARVRAQQRENDAKATTERHRKVAALALSRLLGAEYSAALITGADLRVAEGVFAVVEDKETDRGEWVIRANDDVLIQRRCSRGHALKTVHILHPNDSTLADLGDLLQMAPRCEQCQETTELGAVAAELADVDEHLESALRHLSQAIEGDALTCQYHAALAVERVELAAKKMSKAVAR